MQEKIETTFPLHPIMDWQALLKQLAQVSHLQCTNNNTWDAQDKAAPHWSWFLESNFKLKNCVIALGLDWVECIQLRNISSVEVQVKAGLHYGNYCTKLVHFEAQKIFSMFKKALA
jgi:hypothetical protein